MEYILIILTIIAIILLVLIYLKVSPQNNVTSDKEFAILGEKLNSAIVTIENSNQKIISQEIIKIASALGNNNEKLVEKLGGNNETLTKALGANNEKLAKEFFELKTGLNSTINQFNNSFKVNLDTNFEKLVSNIEIKLEKINEKVEDRLRTGFEKTNETFNSIIARLAKIDEAQKNIESLSGNILSLQDVLTDKKSRGTFGEVQLYQILNAVFGEAKDKLYQTQYSFGNNKIVDAVLFAPEPIGTLAIDSKFPLENYRRMVDRELSDSERKLAENTFKGDMKKHIDDISSKYIIPGVTSDQAIMFLPAEAIFAELNAYFGDVIEYAQKKKVWIASPTTLMAVLNTLQIIVKNAEREKYAHVIQEELVKLSTEFGRYKIRWEKLSSDIDKVSKDVRDINTTSEKISKRFESISNVDDDIKLIEN
ncbi:MAG: DNA recombination protein RmuC [Fusobacteriaceae bacterium]